MGGKSQKYAYIKEHSKIACCGISVYEKFLPNDFTLFVGLEKSSCKESKQLFILFMTNGHASSALGDIWGSAAVFTNAIN